MVVRISDKTQNYSKVTKLLVKPNNLHYYDSFEQGLKFQKEYTLDSFTKALRLEEIRSMNDEKTYFQMVNAFLIVYGYKYEYEDDKWIK